MEPSKQPSKQPIVERLELPSGYGRARRLAEVTRTKYSGYGYAPEPSGFDGALGVVPRQVLAWTSVAHDPTRFRFG